MNLLDDLKKIAAQSPAGHETFEALRPHIEQAAAIRDELSLEDSAKAYPKNPALTMQQDKMEQYLRGLFSLCLYLDIPKGGNSPCQFTWSGKLAYITFRNPNFYYEIACVFYNYSAAYVTKGMELWADPSQAKTALRFFRLAMWGFEQSERAMAKCLVTGTAPPELATENLRACQHFAGALAYRALFQGLRGQLTAFTLDQRTSLHKAAYLKAYDACELVKKNDCQQFIDGNRVRKLVRFLHARHLAALLTEKAREYGSKHREEITKGHIGTQLGYLEALGDCREDLAELALDQGETELLATVDLELRNLPQLRLENEQVYHAKVPGKHALPPIPDSEHQILPLEQPLVTTLLESVKLSARSVARADAESSLERLAAKAKAAVAERAEHVERARIEAFRQARVDVLTQAATQGKCELDEQLIELRDVLGGHSGFFALLERLNVEVSASDRETALMVHKIQQDGYEDTLFTQQYGQALCGLRNPANPFLVNFEKHGVALTELRRRTAALNIEFVDLGPLLKSIENGETEKQIASLRARLSHVEGIAELATKVQKLNEMIRDHIEPERKKLLHTFDTYTTPALVHHIFFLKKTFEEVFADATAELQTQSESFEAKLSQLTRVVQRICLQAAEIAARASVPDHEAEVEQRLCSDVQRLRLFHETVQRCLEASQAITKSTASLKKYLEDYAASKASQKQEIVSNITVFRNLGAYFDRFLESQVARNPFFRQ